MGEIIKSITLFLFIISGGTLFEAEAQQVRNIAPETIFRLTENPPQPKGGMCAFYEYTDDNLQRPPEAIRNGIKGNVFVRFIVERDGKLSNIKVVKGIGGGCDEAVVQLLKDAPRWIPGQQKGTPVRVQKTICIKVR